MSTFAVTFKHPLGPLSSSKIKSLPPFLPAELSPLQVTGFPISCPPTRQVPPTGCLLPQRGAPVNSFPGVVLHNCGQLVHNCWEQLPTPTKAWGQLVSPSHSEITFCPQESFPSRLLSSRFSAHRPVETCDRLVVFWSWWPALLVKGGGVACQPPPENLRPTSRPSSDMWTGVVRDAEALDVCRVVNSCKLSHNRNSEKEWFEKQCLKPQSQFPRKSLWLN